MSKRLSVYGVPILFLLPALLLYTLLLINPIIQSVYMSFFEWNGIAKSPLVFAGLDNYKDMFTNPVFWNSLKNVGYFIAGSFLVLLPLSFALAMVVTSKLRGVRFFKTAFFIPVVLPMTAVGLMFNFILYPNGGMVNTVLDLTGLGSLARNWLGDPQMSTISVVLVNEWIWAGFNMMIFAAGLVGIPQEIHQAAEVDGASGWKKLRLITVPMLNESFKIFSILAITGSLRVFDIIYVMTSGGPNNASDVPATLLYYEAFRYNHFGLSNSIGVFILVVSMLASAILNKVMKHHE